ncbi:MAG: hypothetical protein A2136_11155 [Chloroflexi bacterium RBG_16_54_11]|nr:MAG: hypothetical protein A2136_11155 [Chloroflexi bacterium RBG_16_54_11]
MKYIVFRILSGLVLMAVIAGIAILAYNAGVAHGTSLTEAASAGQSGAQSYPLYGGHFWWPFPFFGFGFFGLLAVLFLLSIAFGAFRYMLFGPRFGWHRLHHRYGIWDDKGAGDDVSPMFAEMHRRVHAAEGEKPADQATQKKE